MLSLSELLANGPVPAELPDDLPKVGTGWWLNIRPGAPVRITRVGYRGKGGLVIDYTAFDGSNRGYCVAEAWSILDPRPFEEEKEGPRVPLRRLSLKQLRVLVGQRLRVSRTDGRELLIGTAETIGYRAGVTAAEKRDLERKVKQGWDPFSG